MGLVDQSHWRVLALASVCVIAAAFVADAQDTSTTGGPVLIIDPHAPLIRNRRGNASATAAQALRLMDEHKIEKTIVLPPPFPPGHRGTYGREVLAPEARDNPNRFAFVAGGESLNPMVHAV